MDSERLGAAPAAMANGVMLGWKYISGVGGSADANYPVKVDKSVDILEMSIGRGEIT